MVDEDKVVGVDLDQFVRVMGEAVVVADTRGEIVLWNPAAERIFGFSAAEALGRSLDLINPERYRARHWEGFFKTMQTGQTKYGNDLLRVPALHKDGRSLSIAFTVALLSDPSGAITSIAAIIRDETARWQDERQLRRRLAELEAKVAQPANS